MRPLKIFQISTYTVIALMRLLFYSRLAIKYNIENVGGMDGQRIVEEMAC